MSGMKVFSALVLLLEIIGVDIGISRIGLELLMTLPNSRTTESEGMYFARSFIQNHGDNPKFLYQADNVGLRLMAQACYDPRKSVQYVSHISHCFYWTETEGHHLQTLGKNDRLREEAGRGLRLVQFRWLGLLTDPPCKPKADQCT